MLVKSWFITRRASFTWVWSKEVAAIVAAIALIWWHVFTYLHAYYCLQALETHSEVERTVIFCNTIPQVCDDTNPYMSKMCISSPFSRFFLFFLASTSCFSTILFSSPSPSLLLLLLLLLFVFLIDFLPLPLFSVPQRWKYASKSGSIRWIIRTASCS